MGVGDGFTILQLYHITEDLAGVEEVGRNNKQHKIPITPECKDTIPGDKKYITSLQKFIIFNPHNP